MLMIRRVMKMKAKGQQRWYCVRSFLYCRMLELPLAQRCGLHLGLSRRKTYATSVVDKSVVVQVLVSVEAGVARGRWSGQ